jgi:hypothetical protein
MVHFIFTRRHARHALALLTGQIQPRFRAARVLPSFRGPMHVPVHRKVSEEVDQEESPRGAISPRSFFRYRMGPISEWG